MTDDTDDRDDEIIEPTPLVGPDPVPDESLEAAVADALADPGAFVAGMTEARTYSTFVPIPPNVLKALLGPLQPLGIEGTRVGSRSGSVVTSADPDVIRQVRDRFGRHPLPDNPGE